MLARFDVVIIGAGPAGMSAAIDVAKHGATVCILDEQRCAGGQIYRNVSKVDPTIAPILGKDYLAGRHLVAALDSSMVEYHAAAIVWDVNENGTVTYSQNGVAKQVQGLHIIVATGAIERPVPIPGWTLPGVMTVGAAQILMKSGGARGSRCSIGRFRAASLSGCHTAACCRSTSESINRNTNQSTLGKCAQVFFTSR